jgi:16S rRNA (guanine(966)-N(2))-methyltransferase RsmD
MNTRPTTDRVKENLFNIIRSDVGNAVFLDLFSGSGNLGIEALSRGANSGIFVDKSPDCVKIIKENLEHTKLSEKGTVFCADFKVALKKLNNSKKFTLIFLDPPYDTGNLSIAIKLIEEYDLLENNGLIAIERSKTDMFYTEYTCVEREEIYGNSTITLLRKVIKQ